MKIHSLLFSDSGTFLKCSLFLNYSTQLTVQCKYLWEIGVNPMCFQDNKLEFNAPLLIFHFVGASLVQNGQKCYFQYSI